MLKIGILVETILPGSNSVAFTKSITKLVVYFIPH
jgi:hypothetical protein